MHEPQENHPEPSNPLGIDGVEFIKCTAAKLLAAGGRLNLRRDRRHQAWIANIWSLAMDMAPKNAVASIFGIGGMCSAIGGMCITQIVGFVLTRSGNNHTLLFTMIPSAYFIALGWIWLFRPRGVNAASEQ